MEKPNKEEIMKAFREKNALKPCPRCDNRNFQFLGLSQTLLTEDPRIVNIGGPLIPLAIIGCSNCGYIIQHALPRLGFKSEAKEESK